jgi:hypothetical protein
MANTKNINTRIRLKYDSCANWIAANPTLLSGEIAIAYLSTTNAVKPGENDTQYPVLFKVGPGAFNDLPWASALAADVYAWAKKEGVKVEGSGNAVTGVGIDVDGYLTFNKGETFATKDELEELRGGLEADTNTTYEFEIPTSGDNAGKLVVYKNEIGGTKTQYQVLDIIVPSELTDALSNKLDANGWTNNENNDGWYHDDGLVEAYINPSEIRVGYYADGGARSYSDLDGDGLHIFADDNAGTGESLRITKNAITV